MEENVINLNQRKLERAREFFENAIVESDEEFDFIDDDFLENHVQEGNVSLENVVKLVWHLAESMDKLEEELLKFKLDVLTILRGGDIS